MRVFIGDMNFTELTNRVLQEGYGHLLFERGPALLAIYDFRIEKPSRLFSKWQVCDYERGAILCIHLETRDEAAACTFWYERVSRMSLLLHSWESNEQAERAAAALQAAGISSRRNDLPDDPAFKGIIYRNFVDGRDLAQGALVVAALT